MSLNANKLTKTVANFGTFSLSWKICCSSRLRLISERKLSRWWKVLNYYFSGRLPAKICGDKRTCISGNIALIWIFGFFGISKYWFKDHDKLSPINLFSKRDLSIELLMEGFKLIILKNKEFQNWDLLQISHIFDIFGLSRISTFDRLVLRKKKGVTSSS